MRLIDTESEPGAWADAIAHSPCMVVEWFERDDAGLYVEVMG